MRAGTGTGRLEGTSGDHLLKLIVRSHRTGGRS
jgi:hypothetical protein